MKTDVFPPKGIPHQPQEVLRIAKELLKKKRSQIKDIKFMWRDLEVLGEATNALGKRKTQDGDTGTTGIMIKRRRADPVSIKICGDLAKSFDMVPKVVEDLKSLIKAPLACKLPVSVNVGSKALSSPDLICRLKRAMVFKGEEKAGVEDLNLALKGFKDKFHRMDPAIFGEIVLRSGWNKLRFYAILEV
ncbi:9501_t:CDS:2 [Dentiscutata erythropus]|uniref:9501_t:CDS:1 n=1 Tax=Dentiscutata erythropus TaxID=1348616 RepID=A0A9N8ZBL8_9GLOM|nr:9501_t:CDS:2 [Dentiscutata erythropus]